MIIKVGMTVEDICDMLADEEADKVVTDIGMHDKRVVDLVFGEPDEDKDEDEEDEEEEDASWPGRETRRNG